MTLDKARIFTSGLTGSGKHRRPPSRRIFPGASKRLKQARARAGAARQAAPVLPGESLTAIEGLARLNEHCDEMAAVAGLMERCGEDPSAGQTARLGIWMSRKVRDIQALAQAIWEAL
jgi:hypothetical protein